MRRLATRPESSGSLVSSTGRSACADHGSLLGSARDVPPCVIPPGPPRPQFSGVRLLRTGGADIARGSYPCQRRATRRSATAAFGQLSGSWFHFLCSSSEQLDGTLGRPACGRFELRLYPRQSAGPDGSWLCECLGRHSLSRDPRWANPGLWPWNRPADSWHAHPLLRERARAVADALFGVADACA